MAGLGRHPRARARRVRRRGRDVPRRSGRARGEPLRVTVVDEAPEEALARAGRAAAAARASTSASARPTVLGPLRPRRRQPRASRRAIRSWSPRARSACRSSPRSSSRTASRARRSSPSPARTARRRSRASSRTSSASAGSPPRPSGNIGAAGDRGGAPRSGRGDGARRRGLELPALPHRRLPPEGCGAAQHHAGPHRLARLAGGVRRGQGAGLREPDAPTTRAVIDVDDAGLGAVRRRGGGARRARRARVSRDDARTRRRVVRRRVPHARHGRRAAAAARRRRSCAIRGEHNVSNALAAAAAAPRWARRSTGIRAGLRSFQPIEHRLEPVEWVARRRVLQRLEGDEPRRRAEGAHRVRRPAGHRAPRRAQQGQRLPRRWPRRSRRAARLAVLFGEARPELAEAFARPARSRCARPTTMLRRRRVSRPSSAEAGRRRAALAGVRELRRVHELRAPRPRRSRRPCCGSPRRRRAAA